MNGKKLIWLFSGLGQIIVAAALADKTHLMYVPMAVVVSGLAFLYCGIWEGE